MFNPIAVFEKKLLENYRAGEAGLEDAMAYALDFLNSEQGESLAGDLVSRGERGLESLKSMSRDGAVGRVLERLADPSLEERIMRGIEGIDTDQVWQMTLTLLEPHFKFYTGFSI